MTNSEFQKKLDLLENRVKALEEKLESPHHEFKVGDRVRFNTPKTKYGKIIEIVIDIAVVQDDNGEKYSIKVEDLHSATAEPKCKFKVGDKVIIAEKSDTHNGDIAMILSQPKTDNDWYKVGFDNGNWTLCPEWTLEPYTELCWTFTDDEKVILRNLPDEFKWIARDSDEYLAVFTAKPRKDCKYSVWLAPGNCLCLKEFNHIFQSIKWEDEEPCEFRNYI